jgi:hypothetical protein
MDSTAVNADVLILVIGTVHHNRYLAREFERFVIMLLKNKGGPRLVQYSGVRPEAEHRIPVKKLSRFI